MSSSSKLLIVFSGVILSLALAGVIVFAWVLRPNRQVFVTGCVTLMGKPGWTDVAYDTISIGDENRRYTGALPVWIRVSLGTGAIVIPIHEFDPAVVMAFESKDVVRWGGLDINVYHVGSVTIYSRGSNVQAVFIGGFGDVSSVELRTQMTEGDWIALPLDENEAVTLFGKPDHTRRFFML